MNPDHEHAECDGPEEGSIPPLLTAQMLARVIYRRHLLGIAGENLESAIARARPPAVEGDDEVDTGDERYGRALQAARTAMEQMYREDAPLLFGEPVGPPATSIAAIYEDVVGAVHYEYQAWFITHEVGINTHDFYQGWRLRRAAGRRAIASLFGEQGLREVAPLILEDERREREFREGELARFPWTRSFS